MTETWERLLCEAAAAQTMAALLICLIKDSSRCVQQPAPLYMAC